MNIPEPAPIDSYISENENYKRSMYLNAWHTASTQAEIGGSQYHIPRSVKIQYTNQYPNFLKRYNYLKLLFLILKNLAFMEMKEFLII